MLHLKVITGLTTNVQVGTERLSRRVQKGPSVTTKGRASVLFLIVGSIMGMTVML